MYDFVLILVRVPIVLVRLPFLPGARIDQGPPLKHAYYAYQGYYSGKMYDIVSILVRVPIVLVR